MKKKTWILLVLVAVAIVGVVVYDWNSTRIGNRPGNPFEYNVDEYKSVDDHLIGYREIRQIEIETGEPRAFAFHGGKIYLLTDTHLQIISPNGTEILKKTLDADPRAIAMETDGSMVVAYSNRLVYLAPDGTRIRQSEPQKESSLFTAITAANGSIYVADAGERQVLVFDNNLELTGGFKGESGVSAVHGFIVPNLHFHLAVNLHEELWVTNPGLHTIQNYTSTGRLRGHWGNAGFGWSGFSGCCNPVYIAFLSDGRYVTSEKGIIRVKVYSVSGEFEKVVAPAEKFKNGTRAPALAVDEQDNVWILDFDKKLIRMFSPA